MNSSLNIPTIIARLAGLRPLAGDFRFPMPEFESGYTYPPIHTPLPVNRLEGWDVPMLLLMLSLAAYLVLKRRRRSEVFLLTLFSLLYFGFLRKGCVCPVGSVQNVAESLFHSVGIAPAILAFFLLPLLFALFFGRVFCAAVCPLGAIQEAVAIRPVAVPPAADRVLSLIPPLYLGLSLLAVATGAGYLICRYDPFVGFFRMDAGFEMLLFGGTLLLLGLFVARPYCRYLCPYGVLLDWMSRLSWRHATITPSECIRCTLCAESCPYQAILPPSSGTAPEPRRRGAHRLGRMILLLPLLVALGAWAGWLAREPLSRIHPEVRLAERIAGEALGFYSEPNLDTESFRNSGRSIGNLNEEVLRIKGTFARGGSLFGAFIGLVIGGKLIAHARLKKRDGYTPDRATCLSCARCFDYCPVKE